MKPMQRMLPRSAAALLLAAALGLLASGAHADFATPPDAAGNLASISVTTSGLDQGCPLSYGTVTMVFTAGMNVQYNQQQISVYGEILGADDEGGCDGFTQTCQLNGGAPDPAWWVIEAGTTAEVNGSGLASEDDCEFNCACDGASTWPNNGGWDTPAADDLSFTGQTITAVFNVGIPRQALNGTTYYLELGVNYGNYQNSTGASEGYDCIPFTIGTVSGNGCYTPTGTPSVSASPTPSSGTATPTPTAAASGTPVQSDTPTQAPTSGIPTISPTGTPMRSITDTYTPVPPQSPTMTLTPNLTPGACVDLFDANTTPSAGALVSGDIILFSPVQLTYVFNTMLVSYILAGDGSNPPDGTVQVGIYSNNGGSPGTLLVQCANQEATQGVNYFSLPGGLSPGLYWVGLRADTLMNIAGGSTNFGPTSDLTLDNWNSESLPATVIGQTYLNSGITSSVTIYACRTIGSPATTTPTAPSIRCDRGSLTAYPNLIRDPGGQSRLTVFSCKGGKAKLRILRATGRTLLTLWEGNLQPQQTQSFTWDGRDDAGNLVPSGVYYVAFTDGDGTHEIQKVLIIR